jgi:LacI family transcriptional regulator
MSKSNNRRSTIRTVAEFLNLSPTTVSLALRGDSSIPPETRNRVLVAAKELDYHYVSRVRKTPERERLKRLVYCVKDYGDTPAVANPFYGQVLNGVQQACQEQHVSLSFVTMVHDYPDSQELPPALTHDVDGIIMSSPYTANVLERVARVSGCPIVLIDNTFPGSPYDTIMADDFGGGYQVTQHLLELGHTHIQMITGFTLNPDVPPSFQERYRGYCAACEAAGVEPLLPALIPPEVEAHNIRRMDLYESWIQSLIVADPHLTAFFGAGDVYAIRTLQSLQSLGYQVPDEFSVVGYDDYETSSLVNPPLTTIHSYKRAMGAAAVRQLLARIAGDDMPPLYITVGVNMRVRTSSGIAPQREFKPAR